MGNDIPIPESPSNLESYQLPSPPQWLCQDWLLIEASHCQEGSNYGSSWCLDLGQQLKPLTKKISMLDGMVASEGPLSYVTHFAYPAASSFFTVVKLGAESSANRSSDLPFTLFSPRRVPLRIHCPSNGPSGCKLPWKIVHGVFCHLVVGHSFGLTMG